MIIVYTGDGKGKTTASLGLAVRALGHNQNICIIQFLKSKDFKTGEYLFFKNLNIEIYPTGEGFSWKGNPEIHRQAIKNAWELTKQKVYSNNYNLIILDEINNLFSISNFKINDILSIDDLTEMLKNTPPNLNIVLTGRNAKSEIVEIADLVSEIKSIKHPYEFGISASKAIEY